MSLWAGTVWAHAWHRCLTLIMTLLEPVASSAPERGAAGALLCPGLGVSGCLAGEKLVRNDCGGGKWSRDSKRHRVRLLGAGMHPWMGREASAHRPQAHVHALCTAPPPCAGSCLRPCPRVPCSAGGLGAARETDGVGERSARAAVRIPGSPRGRAAERAAASPSAATPTRGPSTRVPRHPRSRSKSLLGAKRPMCQLGKEMFLGLFPASEGLGPAASPEPLRAGSPLPRLPALPGVSRCCPAQPQRPPRRGEVLTPCLDRESPALGSRAARGRAGSGVKRDAQAGAEAELPARVLPSLKVGLWKPAQCLTPLPPPPPPPPCSHRCSLRTSPFIFSPLPTKGSHRKRGCSLGFLHKRQSRAPGGMRGASRWKRAPVARQEERAAFTGCGRWSRARRDGSGR